MSLYRSFHKILFAVLQYKALVVPAFQLEENYTSFPETKEDLIRMEQAGTLRMFQYEVLNSLELLPVGA